MYVEWLRKTGEPLYGGGGIWWRRYRGALIPAAAGPCFPVLGHDEAKRLLRESGASFLRYSAGPYEEETQWWYVVCGEYDFNKLPGKMKGMINRGLKQCSVRRIGAEWLAEHGYGCYGAAFGRYRNARPLPEDAFRREILGTSGGPFENWGVFVGGELAGYCQCIMEDDTVSTSSIKLHPGFLKYYSSYALIHALCEQYVSAQRRRLSNFTRSISHDTRFQEFLGKFGFRKLYCGLHVIYRPWLGLAVRMAYPARGLLRRIPDVGIVHAAGAILLQEQVRRSCLTIQTRIGLQPPHVAP